MEYMTYHWETDQKWLGYYANNKSNTLIDEKTTKKEVEGMKRAYYGS